MSALENFTDKFKHFGPTTWSIKNKTSIYLLMMIVSIIGIYQFYALPKEQYPDVVQPQIYVQTIYVGNSPKDMENLVTRPLEKQIKSISGAKVNKVTSTSQQDFSVIIVEFSTDVKTDVALQKVKDALDKAKQDLPTDLTQLPTALEISTSDFPIMYVNVSGNFDLMQLKKYADDVKDSLENISQINRVDQIGAPEREFQINVDRTRMQAAGVTYDDIANAVARENVDISGGLLQVGNMKRNLQLKGQFKTSFDIEKVVVNNIRSAPIYLRDIATIKDTIKQSESYARLNGNPVITLSILKRPGENLIETSDNVKLVVERMKANQLPEKLDVVITGDSSNATRTSLSDLVNSIVIGFILVLLILMFFMGVVNAFFVALSVPLSVFVAFMFMPGADLIVGTHVTLNFMVLFALLFALGIIVDDAIVVIENTHRIFVKGKGLLRSDKAAMMAAGEVFVPVLAGTVTTLAPFFPLLLWPGVIGKFMIYIPTILIFTLTASLIVAFIMNPVFAVDFMNAEEENGAKRSKTAIFRKPGLWIAVGLGILLDIGGMTFWGNLLLTLVILSLFNRFILTDAINRFQKRVMPAIMARYEQLLRWALKGWRPVYLLISVFGLLIFSLVLFVVVNPPVSLFPNADPNQIYVYIKLPVGTDVDYTDSVTCTIEEKVNRVLGIDKAHNKTNPIVESVISNVAKGAADPFGGDQSVHAEWGRIQVSFLEFSKRNGISSRPYLDSIRNAIKGIPGAEISVAQEQGGPPEEPPVNVEVSSDDFDMLTKTAANFKYYLDSLQIPGIEELKMDVDLSNPEITLTVDRERCMREGLSSAQVGSEIRTALFGREVSKIKEGKDEYKIQLRNNELQRKDLTDLLNMSITFRDFATGAIKHVPIASLVSFDYTNTLGSVKRKDYKRVITIRSNLLTEYQSRQSEINQQIATAIQQYDSQKPENVSLQQTGANEQIVETFSFLGRALVAALLIILLVLVLQFNSVSKSVIILTEILFSIIGVVLGFSFTGMEVSAVMTGIGIVGLAGIVVKNGILVIEFTDELRARGMKTREAAIEAGKTRIIPVMLTALAAILALIPLGVGFNINFITLFSELNPHIFFGGDSAAFWKPLSWTIIFGLAFAFFMTLFMVPSMYLIAERLRRPMRRMYGGKWVSFMGVPPLTLLFIPMTLVTSLYHRVERKRRARRLRGNRNVNEAFIGSWF